MGATLSSLRTDLNRVNTAGGISVTSSPSLTNAFDSLFSQPFLSDLSKVLLSQIPCLSAHELGRGEENELPAVPVSCAWLRMSTRAVFAALISSFTRVNAWSGTTFGAE